MVNLTEKYDVVSGLDNWHQRHVKQHIRDMLSEHPPFYGDQPGWKDMFFGVLEFPWQSSYEMSLYKGEAYLSLYAESARKRKAPHYRLEEWYSFLEELLTHRQKPLLKEKAFKIFSDEFFEALDEGMERDPKLRAQDCIKYLSKDKAIEVIPDFYPRLFDSYKEAVTKLEKSDEPLQAIRFLLSAKENIKADRIPEGDNFIKEAIERFNKQYKIDFNSFINEKVSVERQLESFQRKRKKTGLKLGL